jgi:hypothetical protein
MRNLLYKYLTLDLMLNQEWEMTWKTENNLRKAEEDREPRTRQKHSILYTDAGSRTN